MASLTAKSPFEGLLPFATDGAEAYARPFDALTSVMPFKGQETRVSKALQAKIGLGLPKPRRAQMRDDTCIAWVGLGQFFVLGPRLRSLEGAAITDQSDAWGAIRLEGPDAKAVLARLMPIDLRANTFPHGHGARSLLGQTPVVLLHLNSGSYDLLVFRSMAKSTVHELSRAMKAVSARSALEL